VPSNAQEDAHPHDFDYVEGSPHLKHPTLRTRVEDSLRELVAEQLTARGRCRVLEVGAGHGGFTEVLLAAGADVTVTEMSGPSAEAIAARYDGDPRVTVVYDPNATWADETSEQFDLVACISVLHHIPDYVAFLESMVRLTSDGGSFVSWQDPTWYPRRTLVTHRAEQASYFAWRARQGDLKRGLQTRVRRLRGVYDETNSADMSEYHVVRSGVDQLALQQCAQQHYASVQLVYYWSTQSGLGQRLGDRWNLPNTFALVARDRIARLGQ
jgi:SAM-dependent methyltransferase